MNSFSYMFRSSVCMVKLGLLYVGGNSNNTHNWLS